MKDKRTYTHLKEHGEDITHENEFKVSAKEDRGPLDLTKQIDGLKLTIQMYQQILRDAQKQIYYWKKFSYEDEKNKAASITNGCIKAAGAKRVSIRMHYFSASPHPP